MANVLLYICLCAVVSAGYGGRRSVHLPGVTPHSYEIGETVSLSLKRASAIFVSKAEELHVNNDHVAKPGISQSSNFLSLPCLFILPLFRSISLLARSPRSRLRCLTITIRCPIVNQTY